MKWKISHPYFLASPLFSSFLRLFDISTVIDQASIISGSGYPVVTGNVTTKKSSIRSELPGDPELMFKEYDRVGLTQYYKLYTTRKKEMNIGSR